MARLELVAVAIFGLLVALTVGLAHELGMSVVVSGLLAVSAVAVGVMLTVALHGLVGLSAIGTAIVLGLAVFALTIAYEVAT